MNKKATAYGSIGMLLLALIAFTYIISQEELVKGAPTTDSTKTYSTPEDKPTGSGGAGGDVAGIAGTAASIIPISGFKDTAGIKSATGTVGNTLRQAILKPTTLTTSSGESVVVKAGETITMNTDGTGILTQGDKTYSFSKEILTEAQKAGNIGGVETHSALSSAFGAGGGTVGDALLSGLQWAAIAYGVGQLLGSIFGFNSDNTQALSTALAVGAFTYQGLNTLVSTGGQLSGTGFGNAIGAIGGPIVPALAVAAIIFIAMYKDTETKIVSFNCMTWQAPSGGNNCELCNSDTLPCSEYRCRSLGQNCEIVNAGTTQEKCVNINPTDVNPPIIKPNKLDLTEGHEYTNVKISPPGPGFNIIKTGSSDGCLKAFTPLQFGITTDEPSQCRIDYNSTTQYEDMAAYMGGNNYYSYNHTEIFSLPGAKAFKNSSFKLENGKDLIFYIRCQDKNGNSNEAEYAVKFCMDPTPDTTAPQIKATSIINGGCVNENATTANVEFYTDEPAECKWSHTDQAYEDMIETMNCGINPYQLNAQQLFTCKAALSGIARDNTDFYIRCKDQPGIADKDRNKNMESYKYTLRTSNALKLKNVQPNSTIFGGVSPAPVELYAETLFGCEQGKATCYYSTTPNLGDFIQFYDTNNEDGINTQRQDLVAGQHKYYIRCVDSGGNVAETTTEFTLDIDTSAPVIARAYEESNMLKIITVRQSECSYTYDNCDFTFEEGNNMPYANSTVHVAEWNKDKTYYIKCRDEYLNEPAECSTIIRPSQKIFSK